MTSKGPAIIVLAAGRGSRFDSVARKLEQSLGGSTVLGTTLRQAMASHLQVVVVTTPALAVEARRHLAARDIVVLPEAGSGEPHAFGMGHSIGAGVSARPNARGWLVLPADMPLVCSSSLKAVARELAGHAVVYAQHKGRRGHPVGFAAELYSELMSLHGDEGARRLVARYPAVGVELNDPGVLTDVDTPADLESVRRLMAATATATATRYG